MKVWAVYQKKKNRSTTRFRPNSITTAKIFNSIHMLRVCLKLTYFIEIKFFLLKIL